MQDMPENQHNRLTERGRLSARLVQGKKEAMPPGLHPLALNEKSDALLYVPTSYQPDRSIPRPGKGTGTTPSSSRFTRTNMGPPYWWLRSRRCLHRPGIEASPQPL